MKNLLIISKMIVILSMTTIALVAYADGDESTIFKRWFENKKSGVSVVQFQQYNDLCGSCHFPYQPGLLPALSWEKVMADLDKHFGEPVHMTAVEKRTMTRFLLDNSAGHRNDEVSNKILQSLKYNPIPLRITDTPYFVYQHDKNQTYKGLNKQNMGQCDSCHQDALQGEYKKHRLLVPNFKQNSSHDKYGAKVLL